MAVVSHAARNAGLAAVIIVAVIGAAGFAVPVQVTSVTAKPVVVETPTVVTYVTSSQSVATVAQSTTASQTVWAGSDISLKPNYYDYYPATFGVGYNVQFSWSASIAVDIYVFNSAEFAAYQSSGTTSPSIYSNTAQSGSSSFYVSGAGTYYLVVHDPYGVFGIGASNAGYTTSGTDVYPTTTYQYITQTVTYTTSSSTFGTYTSTSTETKTCSTPFWYSLSSPTCP